VVLRVNKIEKILTQNLVEFHSLYHKLTLKLKIIYWYAAACPEAGRGSRQLLMVASSCSLVACR